ncbi:MAG: hypothetical protein PHV58_01630 [Candidatus Omnitrophica bacterium]|nr:hypothetical protein [Candidatus Omnitrophota bacterium]MDD5662434.1 hypothetical protein [Candidatus Omnitrophota bacterium]
MLRRSNVALLASIVLTFAGFTKAFATPSTLIWAPSTDVKPLGVLHLDADNYTPVKSRDHNDNKLLVLQDYGLMAGLLTDNPEKNPLGKLWSPLGKLLAETGFDYKKGLGSTLDKWPVYFHFKLGVPEGAYFKNMPAFAVGCYDMGYKHNYTNYNVWYLRGAKTINIGKLNLGRFSAGYFNGNAKLLRNKDSERDNAGVMLAWERVISEISDRLWICVDYQGTQSSYGALNYGFSWKFTNNVSAILGYDVYNSPNSKNTVTFQLDVDF